MNPAADVKEVFEPKTTVTMLAAFRSRCLCGWVAPERWRRYDEAATDLHAHIRQTHPESIELLSVRRTVLEETSWPDMAEGEMSE